MNMQKKMNVKIGHHEIKENGRVFIIAEAGVNHNGRLDLALKLVDLAAEIGADVVKFQSFKPENVVTPEGKMAAYQVKNIGKPMTQLEMARSLVLPYEFHKKIIKRCKEKGIIFMSTPHGGRESVDFLESLNVPAYKIGSGDLTNYILLEHVARLRKPIIISTGMATLKETKQAVKFIESKGNKKIIVLHCTTDYPCPPEEVNLRAMQTLMNKIDYPVGYSDHTEGNEVAAIATAMGAAVYEFHITLDKTLPGPDQKASADPKEAKIRIDTIKKAQITVGDGIKKPNKAELPIAAQVRRHLVASHDLAKGQKIRLLDLEALRPEKGTSPTLYEKFIGKKLRQNLQKKESISFKSIED